MLRVMLVDDEPPARRGLRRLLQAHADVEIVAEAGSVAEAREAMARAAPDAVFLDVEMSDGLGFDLVAGTPAPGSAAPVRVVFVTAHDAHAVRAFEVPALDFLLKPVDPARLGVALNRLRAGPAEAPPAPPAPDRAAALPAEAPLRLHLRVDGRSAILPLAEIATLQAEADFTRIVSSGGGDHLVCRLLKTFEAQLPSPPFLRVSRSLIVNLDRIERIDWDGAGGCVLGVDAAAAPIRLGRAAGGRLRQALAEDRRFVLA
ncbi:MAG: LytR/AlgR family response regulator transcription factor [Albimonas sp.]|uniref:LytR/AlgR family response regulator transcription factor n=1 Tax=Albimonas sp. TaxID=1872425 RepID=UPI00405735B5